MVKKLLSYFFVLILAPITLALLLQSSGNAQGKQPEEKTQHKHIKVCQIEEKDSFSCTSRVLVDNKGSVIRNTTPVGYGPVQFKTGYNLQSSTPSAQIIAIVDAYDNPNALSDLNFYSKTFGIQQLTSCSVSKGTSTTPCFQKVNQQGTTSYPRANSGWVLESSLDLQVAHAVCPTCSILLVEARSSSYSDLMAAVDRARLMGVKIISNSYGSNEFSSETTYDQYFNHPGVMYVFSSGDNGYGASYPAASQYVTSVGGTTLNLNADNSYQSETVWNGTGSGCSTYESKPSWQKDSSCSKRAIADVSADADPNTGAAVYDSFGYSGAVGWFQVGGTSLSAPLIAGVYALSGTIPYSTVGASLPYTLGSYSSNLHDITSGNNGSCNTTYLCTAGNGYDGPTGLGSPKGTTAF